MADICNVGDTVYRLSKNGIIETKITTRDPYPPAVYRLENWPESYFERAFGKTLFLTSEDANKAVQDKVNIAEKRKLLKEYETELNKRFGLTDHRIIK